MASADYSVGTKVTADVSNFEKGMNKAEKSLKGFSEKLANSIDRLGKKGLVGSIANVTLAMTGLTQSFNTVIKFAKDIGKAINECTEAYKGQIIAERALDTAIQNNPFISGASSKALKQFASEMQKVSNYGDEELIPMMTNLVSLGRTESEVMQIMSVAMDMSAGMGISLDTAITQLNATLNGNIGRLGQQNAELKDLTEEELKQGKAIEILGEKFKGLSGATADTSKQLKNIKGDFKEALGQFTLPSSDLWNKFWAGFYQKGIEAINKINAFMDSQIIGKKLANAITEQIARINPGDIGGRIDYTRNVLRVIGDNELEALKNYLSGLRTLSAEQEIILKRIKAEEDSRYQSSINTKKEAEDKKKQADAEAQITAELQKQNEIASKKTDWSSKLLDQRIEMLETERDRAMQFAEEEGKETYTIWRDYNEKILELKLERLEKEKEEALAEENLTAEEKNNFNEYYANEEKKIYNELGKYKKKKNKEQEKDSKNSLKQILNATKAFAKSVGKLFSGIAKTIKAVFSKISSFVRNVFSSTKTIFSKLFEFNIDDALDSLLAIEDAVLTFFVETLPKLPAFVKTVLKSINVMLKTLINSVKKENIATVLFDALDSLKEELPDLMQSISTIIQSTTEFMTENLSTLIYDFLTVLGENVPQVINDLLDLLSTTISEAVEGLLKWLDEGGLQIIFQMLLDMQTKIQDLVLDLLSQIATFLTEHTEDIGAFLADSLTSAFEMLPELIDSILKIITALIQAIADCFKDKEMVQAMVDGLVGGIEAILDNLGDIVSAVIDLIFSIITAIAPKIPEIILKIIKAIADALPDIVSDIAGAIGDGIKSIFKSIFNKDFWIDTLNSLKEVLTSIVQTVFGGIGKLFDITDTTSSGKKKSKVEKGFDIGLGIATGGVYNLGKGIGKLLHWWADGTDNAPAGLSVVGESGPELVNFKGGEQVFNAQETKRILSGANGSTNNFSVTFNNLQDTTAFTMLQQLKQYNRQMAINGII